MVILLAVSDRRDLLESFLWRDSLALKLPHNFLYRIDFRIIGGHHRDFPLQAGICAAASPMLMAGTYSGTPRFSTLVP